MVATHPPRLCFDRTLCRYYVKWGGRRRWLSTNQQEAKTLYPAQVRAWRRWRVDRDTEKARRRICTRSYAIAELYKEFYQAKVLEGAAPLTLAFYQQTLRRFLRTFGAYDCQEFGPRDLHGFKQLLLVQGLAPKTVNHQLSAIRTLFQWGADLEFCQPKNLRGCRNMAIPLRQKPKGWSPEKLNAVLRALPDHVRSWAVVQYACAMRPSEILRVVRRQGQWAEEGIFLLDMDKSAWRSKQPRRIVIAPFALDWLECCEPRFSRLDSYRQAFACKRRYDHKTKKQTSILVNPGGPHRLRHSAATHLAGLGVDRASTDLILGHLPSVVSTTYSPVEWQPLRRLAARLQVHLTDVVPP